MKRIREFLRTVPKISIIIPFYNSEKYILRALYSITLWNHIPHEIICINDGSTDHSLQLVQNFAQTHPNVKVYSFSENRGLYLARLEGIKRACGEYIGFLDSDDFVSNGYFDALYKTAVSNKSDIAVAQIVNRNANEIAYVQERCAIFPYMSETQIEKINVYDQFWKQQGRCYHWHVIWNKLYKRQLFTDKQSLLMKQTAHLVMMEDFIFSSIVLKDVKSFSVNENAKYFYVENDSASTHKKSISGLEKNIQDMNAAFSFVYECLMADDECTKYVNDFMAWRRLYERIWKRKIMQFHFPENVQNRLLEKISKREIIDDIYLKENDNYYYEKISIYNMEK